MIINYHMILLKTKIFDESRIKIYDPNITIILVIYIP